MKLVQKPSPNFSSRNNNQIQLIVIHWTAGTLQSALNWFATKESKVSAHYIIDSSTDTVYQCVQDENAAWHSGYSLWNNIVGCNPISIGIELIGPPSFLKIPSWPQIQITSLIELTNSLLQKHQSIKAVTDHSTIRSSYITYAREKKLEIPPAKYDVLTGTGTDKFPWDEFQSKIGTTTKSASATNPVPKQEVKPPISMQTSSPLSSTNTIIQPLSPSAPPQSILNKLKEIIK